MLKQKLALQTTEESKAQIEEARKRLQFHTIMKKASEVYLRYLELSQEKTVKMMDASEKTIRETPTEIFPALSSIFTPIKSTALEFTMLSSDEDEILDTHALTENGAVEYFEDFLRKQNVANIELISNAFEASLRCSSPCKRVGHYLESPTNVSRPKSELGFHDTLERALKNIIYNPPKEQDTQFYLELDDDTPDLR